MTAWIGQLNIDTAVLHLKKYCLLGYSSSFISICSLFLLLRMQDLGREDWIFFTTVLRYKAPKT